MLRRGSVALFVVALLASTAPAQVVSDEIGIERFRPAIDRAGLFDVEWAGVPSHLTWSAGILVGFAHAPLVVYDRDGTAVDSLVDRRVTTTLVGSLSLWERLQVGITADVVGYQSGSNAAPTMSSLPRGGIGDLRLVAKTWLAGNDHLGVAIVPVLTIPAGGGEGFLREAGVAFAPALAISATADRLRMAVNAGYNMRTRVATTGLVSDDEAFARAALGVAVAARSEAWLSSSVAAPISEVEKNQVAVEMFVGGAHGITRSIALVGAAGFGLQNGFGTPDWRALAGVRYELPSREGAHASAAVRDADGDGIADARDRCAAAAEDVDGFEDGDGCADPDNDGDGIADVADRCPAGIEDKDGFQDSDGCADPMSRIHGRVVDKDGRPIGGAAVSIAQSELTGSPIALTADADGRFTTALHGGTVQVTARATEYKDAAVDTTITPGSTGNVAVTLVRAVRQGQLRGQVLSFRGDPLAARITVASKATTSPTVATTVATTDADGQFTIELPAGTFSVEISSPGHVVQRRSVEIKLDGVTVLNVDLRTTK